MTENMDFLGDGVTQASGEEQSTNYLSDEYFSDSERRAVSYWDAEGNRTIRFFSAEVPESEIPDQIDSPHTGLPAGRNKDAPPQVLRNEPFKTHLAYVKERRTPEEGEALLQEALQKLRERRGTLNRGAE